MERIFLATPSLDGKIAFECHESILKNTHILREKGYEIVPYYIKGHIYIEKARNDCVSKFLSSDCSDLIFIDSDVSFDNDAILKIMQHDKDIIGGLYPLKESELKFPTVICFNDENNCQEKETGLVYAEMIPTGFMRIKRNVFAKMLEAKQDDLYPIVKDSKGIYNFFQTGMCFPDDNTWYGEDVAFCMRWRRMGGKIFIEPCINFVHIGVQYFSGNFHNYLMSLSIKNGNSK